MSDDAAKAVKTVFVTIPDDDVLMLLRDFLEPLGYNVEFASEAGSERPRVGAVKGATGALLFLMLDHIEAGRGLCTHLSFN